ncbi:MAG TPA: dockerin type I domain-containing protein [Phycisphaerae bacterium]
MTDPDSAQVSAPALPGDINADGQVNLTDYAALANCLSGPASAFPTATCCAFDLDHDTDIDLRDFAVAAPQITNP